MELVSNKLQYKSLLKPKASAKMLDAVCTYVHGQKPKIKPYVLAWTV